MTPYIHWSFNDISSNNVNSDVGSATLVAESGVSISRFNNSVYHGGQFEAGPTTQNGVGRATTSIPNYSGSTSLTLWACFKHHQNFNNVFSVYKSGQAVNARYQIDYSGVGNFYLNDGTKSVNIYQSGADPHSWTMYYFGHDQENNRIEYSVNAGDKFYTPYSGSNPLNNAGTLVMQLSGSQANLPIFIDEMTLWSGALTNERLRNLYSNGKPESFGSAYRSNKFQYLYPKSDAWNNTNRSYGNHWFKDPNFVYGTLLRNFEQINHPESLYGLSPELHSNILNQYDLGFVAGKLFIKPSSVSFYVEHGNLNSAMPLDSSGLCVGLLLDKHFQVVASGQRLLSADGADGTTTSNGNRVVLHNTINASYINTENKDLSQTYISFSAPSTNAQSYHIFNSIYQFNVFVSGTDIAYTGTDLIGSGGFDVNSNVDLYTYGMSSSASLVDLYTLGHSSLSSGVDLYTLGAGPINSSVPLVTWGQATQTSGVDLFLLGGLTQSSGVDLFIHGSFSSTSTLPLFIKYVPVEQSGGINLYTYSTTDPSVHRGIDLFLNGPSASSTYSTLPLYITGPASGEVNGSMPLFLYNDTLTTKSLDLYLHNEFQESGRMLKLFTKGEGELNGGLPINGTMPLYMSRDADSLSTSCTLFLKAEESSSSGIDLYISGITGSNASLTLCIPNTYDIKSSSIPLYTHGF